MGAANKHWILAILFVLASCNTSRIVVENGSSFILYKGIENPLSVCGVGKKVYTVSCDGCQAEFKNNSRLLLTPNKNATSCYIEIRDKKNILFGRLFHVIDLPFPDFKPLMRGTLEDAHGTSNTPNAYYGFRLVTSHLISVDYDLSITSYSIKLMDKNESMLHEEEVSGLFGKRVLFTKETVRFIQGMKTGDRIRIHSVNVKYPNSSTITLPPVDLVFY